MAEAALPAQRVITGLKPLILLVGVAAAVAAGVGVMLWEIATRQRFWGDLPEPALIGRLISGENVQAGEDCQPTSGEWQVLAK